VLHRSLEIFTTLKANYLYFVDGLCCMHMATRKYGCNSNPASSVAEFPEMREGGLLNKENIKLVLKHYHHCSGHKHDRRS
jgi:hypothetical protein